MKERLAIVMPVYNEEAAIGKVLDKWCTVLDALGIDYEIHPYNDGSRDNTETVMREAKERHPDSIFPKTKPNSGHGPTILQGYREMSEAGFNWIFQIDSDDEMGTDKFYDLWRNRQKYDFLVGYRDGRKQPFSRKLISAFSRLTVRIFYGKGIWDVNTPYRLMRTEVFKDIFCHIPADTFAPNVIISGLVAKRKISFFEIPVQQHDRTTGEVSIQKWKLIRAAMRSFWQTLRLSFIIDEND